MFIFQTVQNPQERRTSATESGQRNEGGTRSRLRRLGNNVQGGEAQTEVLNSGRAAEAMLDNAAQRGEIGREVADRFNLRTQEVRSMPVAGMNPQNAQNANQDYLTQAVQEYNRQFNHIHEASPGRCAGCGGGRGCCGSFSKEHVQAYIEMTNQNPTIGMHLVKEGKSEEEAKKLAERAMHSLENNVVSESARNMQTGSTENGRALGAKEMAAYAAALGLDGSKKYGVAKIEPPEIGRIVRIAADEGQKNRIERATIVGLFGTENSQDMITRGRENPSRRRFGIGEDVQNRKNLQEAYANMAREKMAHLFQKENMEKVHEISSGLKEIKKGILDALDGLAKGKNVAKKTIDEISDAIKKLEEGILKIKDEKIKAGAKMALDGLKKAFEKLKSELEKKNRERSEQAQRDAKKQKLEKEKVELEQKKLAKAQNLEQKKIRKAQALERQKVKKEQDRKKKEEQKIAKEDELARKKEAKREVVRKRERRKREEKKGETAQKVAQKRNTLKRLADVSKKRKLGKKKKDKKSPELILLHSKKKNKKKLKRLKISA